MSDSITRESWLNDPAVVAQVTAVFNRYEAALIAHDVDALDEFFFNGAATLRLGIGEHGYGIEAIRAYRRRTQPVSPLRRLQNVVVTTIGDSAASVSTEFVVPGSTMIRRQTQTWALTRDGWRIVAAHVSEVAIASLQRD